MPLQVCCFEQSFHSVGMLIMGKAVEGAVYGDLVLPTWFYWEPKTALKIAFLGFSFTAPSSRWAHGSPCRAWGREGTSDLWSR